MSFLYCYFNSNWISKNFKKSKYTRKCSKGLGQHKSLQHKPLSTCNSSFYWIKMIYPRRKEFNFIKENVSIRWRKNTGFMIYLLRSLRTYDWIWCFNNIQCRGNRKHTNTSDGLDEGKVSNNNSPKNLYIY